ncbi:redoxin domain-containing protein [Candidatus Falkowbacteria bacterium]|nr:MAG: redoxin domain-containing protein [Candidatus Falkowbacteria bacterium]
MKNKFLFAGVLIISIGVLIWIFSVQSQKASLNESTQEKVMSENNSSNSNEIVSDKKMMVDNLNTNEVENKKMIENESSEGSMEKDISGMYGNYSESTVAEEQAKGNKVVLFFYAPWCPFCRSADQAFNNRTSEIPSGVTVLKTDYDSNSDLKKKYAVTYQHTFVQIDTDGNGISKWTGGDIDTLKSNLK